MIKQAFQSAEVKKPLIAAALIRYKQAEGDEAAAAPAAAAPAAAAPAPAAAPGMMDKVKDFGSSYGPGVGIGAGAGVLAGLPISVLANAIFGKDKSLRGYLRSALMGSLIGGGLGALGGGGLRYYGESSPERGAKVDAVIDALGGYANQGAAAVGLDVNADAVAKYLKDTY